MNYINRIKTAILAVALLLFNHSFAGETIRSKSIKTHYPTKDWVISDFNVTDFGAKAAPGFDNRVAFQSAINAAYKAGGGVVWIPEGNYEFRSTQTGTRTVRVRKGTDEAMESFNYQYALLLPPGVQLRGDRANPEQYDGRTLGTILEVRVGEGSANYDGKVESWWNDSQAGNALRTTYTSIADRFIEMTAGTGVTNLSIWYPEQKINDVKPYPWTLFQSSGDCATVENVTLVNSYNGFYSAPSELHYLLNNNITALNTGVEVHVCTDIGRIENVKIDPKYWTLSGLPGSPSLGQLTKYTRANATGFKMHRSDWEYISKLYVNGYKMGAWIGREPGYSDTPNAQLYDINIEKCGTGLYVEDVNPYGLLISNSTFAADNGGKSVYFQKDFNTSVQFNGVDFKGTVVSDGTAGVISFENCKFDNSGDYGLCVNNGNILLTQSEFLSPNKNVYIGKDVKTLKSVNSGYNRVLQLINESAGAKVDITNDAKYEFTPIPKNIQTDITVHPRPASNEVFRAALVCTKGNIGAPTTDVAQTLQAALNEVGKSGGGTLYLPAGRYLVNSPITVPGGVELRGNWDVQHHTQSGGTAIFTNWDGGAQGEAGASLISLEKKAGLSGLNIVQANIANDGYSVKNPRKTPFLIQGKGTDVYIVNVTIPVGDKGIDLASYNTSRHYVDYFAGVLTRAAIWVGGGAEGGFIRNMQLNPHYGSRIPQGGQGYPNVSMTRFVQSNCSALQFADVKNQTIFNNFVYGSIYGIHFLKDKITGKDPGQMTIVGHGSDGCTYSLFMENGSADTKIVAINSELVNTHIPSQPVRSYVLLGSEPQTTNVNPLSELILYNSAFWGSPAIGSIVNNGTLRIQQGNFARSGAPGIDVRGGQAHIYTTYFAQPFDIEANKRQIRLMNINTTVVSEENMVYAKLHKGAKTIELTNNFYTSGLKTLNEGDGKIYGADIK